MLQSASALHVVIVVVRRRVFFLKTLHGGARVGSSVLWSNLGDQSVVTWATGVREQRDYGATGLSGARTC